LAEPLELAFRAAVAFHRAGDLPEAIRLYLDILRVAPDLEIAKDNLCLATLAAGDYERGFRLYDRRFERALGRVEKPRLPMPEWRGEDIAGASLLVWPEQGFGDQIMFARFAVALRRRGVKVTLAAPPQLTRLFESLPLPVVADRGAASAPRHDYWVMSGSLPGRMGITAQTLPRDTGLPQTPWVADGAVGVAWRGRPQHHNDANRSLADPLGHKLIEATGGRSLHPEDTGARDFQDTAEIIRGLRLVITVDTAVAHLAGGLGVPTRILLPSVGVDWRWGVSGDRTPWYDSVTLYRQTSPGDWTDVLARVTALL